MRSVNMLDHMISGATLLTGILLLTIVALSGIVYFAKKRLRWGFRVSLFLTLVFAFFLKYYSLPVRENVVTTARTQEVPRLTQYEESGFESREARELTRGELIGLSELISKTPLRWLMIPEKDLYNRVWMDLGVAVREKMTADEIGRNVVTGYEVICTANPVPSGMYLAKDMDCYLKIFYARGDTVSFQITGQEVPIWLMQRGYLANVNLDLKTVVWEKGQGIVGKSILNSIVEKPEGTEFYLTYRGFPNDETEKVIRVTYRNEEFILMGDGEKHFPYFRALTGEERTYYVLTEEDSLDLDVFLQQIRCRPEERTMNLYLLCWTGDCKENSRVLDASEEDILQAWVLEGMDEGQLTWGN